MVLEESLLFDSPECADAFIRYLRKKGCKAHKKTVAGFIESGEWEGPVDNVISFLEDLLGKSAGVGGDADGHSEGEVDEPRDADRDEAGENEGGTGSASDASSRPGTILLLEKLKAGRAGLEKILGSHSEGDFVFSQEDLNRNGEILFRHMAQAMFPIMQKALAKEGIDLPPREDGQDVSDIQAHDASLFLFVSDILEENGLVKKDAGGNYRLIRKVPVEQCRVKVSAEGLPDYEDDELASRGISFCGTIDMSVQHEVVMDGTVIVEFSIDDLEEGLRGLDVDAESLDEFFWNYELKRLAVMAVIEVVGGAGKISLDNLQQKLMGYRIQAKEVAEPVKVTLDHEFLSSLVAEMRKLGYLAGSQENIRLAR